MYCSLTENPEVKIESSRLRLKRTLNSRRVHRLRSFKTKISEWATPSPEVFEEPIIVEIREKRKRTTDGVVEWEDILTFDHLHPRVVAFEDLIDHKKGAGYKVAVSDAVLAYMLIFEWGRKSVITGFLRTFPEWKEVEVDTVGEGLSRLAKEGFITSVTVERPKEPPSPYYIPKPPVEALYNVNREIKLRLLKKLYWWEK